VVVDIVGIQAPRPVLRTVLFGKRGGVSVHFIDLWGTVASFGPPGNDINIGWTYAAEQHVPLRPCDGAGRLAGFPVTRFGRPMGGSQTNRGLVSRSSLRCQRRERSSRSLQRPLFLTGGCDWRRSPACRVPPLKRSSGRSCRARRADFRKSRFPERPVSRDLPRIPRV